MAGVGDARERESTSPSPVQIPENHDEIKDRAALEEEASAVAKCACARAPRGRRLGPNGACFGGRALLTFRYGRSGSSQGPRRHGPSPPTPLAAGALGDGGALGEALPRASPRRGGGEAPGGGLAWGRAGGQGAGAGQGWVGKGRAGQDRTGQDRAGLGWAG